jgi:hypothetical protein
MFRRARQVDSTGVTDNGVSVVRGILSLAVILDPAPGRRRLSHRTITLPI